MRGVTLLLPLVLLGCAAPQPGVFRAVDRQIYSTAVIEPARLAGRWYQVADFAPAGAAPCAAGGVTVSAGLAVEADLCIAGARRSYRGTAAVSGPGRLTLPGAEAEWWILWVDADYRTAVVGTPGGGFGFILNRDPVLPADRMAAAREILAWNGYDLARMRPVSAR